MQKEQLESNPVSSDLKDLSQIVKGVDKDTLALFVGTDKTQIISNLSQKVCAGAKKALGLLPKR